jgi:hypothetical protein
MHSLLLIVSKQGALPYIGGDDALYGCERRDLNKFLRDMKESAKDHGQELALNWTDVFEKLDFCQTRPVEIGSEWRMIRDPYRVLSRTLTDTRYLHTNAYKKYIASVGECLMCCFSGVPVLQEFAARCLEFSTERVNITHTGIYYHAKHEPTRDYAPVQASSRASFHRAYDIHPDLQLLLEEIQIPDHGPCTEELAQNHDMQFFDVPVF